jgi:glycine oxidase
VLPQLHARITAVGGTIKYNSEAQPDQLDGLVIDCRGLAARDDAAAPKLRGVKGEIIIVETDEVQLSRPVRLMHPRWPLYVIPRAKNRFMLGATSIESEDRGVSVRSALELLGAAYAVHPAFAEARILEFGSGLRPAFPDNLPRIAISQPLGGQQTITVNGLYRHGFLLAPALAELTLNYIKRGEIDNEVMQCK